MVEWKCCVNSSEHINNLYPIHYPNILPAAQISTNRLLLGGSSGADGVANMSGRAMCHQTHPVA